jgi:hypothetical protein
MWVKSPFKNKFTNTKRSLAANDGDGRNTQTSRVTGKKPDGCRHFAVEPLFRNRKSGAERRNLPKIRNQAHYHRNCQNHWLSGFHLFQGLPFLKIFCIFAGEKQCFFVTLKSPLCELCGFLRGLCGKILTFSYFSADPNPLQK